MNEVFTAALSLLGSHAKLDRDKGALSFKVALLKVKRIEGGDGELSSLQQFLISYLKSDQIQNVKWENVFGHLEASRILIESSDNPAEIRMEDFLAIGLEFLENAEFRVRIVAGDILGSLCSAIDSNIYEKCEPKLIKSIKENLTRDIPDETSPENTTTTNGTSSIVTDTNSTSNGTFSAKDAKEIFHDTAGWKSLETSMKGLQSIIEGCGESFLRFVNMELLDLIFETLDHTNRFVRETGYYVCASLARYGVSSQAGSQTDVAGRLAQHLCIGLADNWSQVRLAASVATRQFFEGFQEEDKKLYFKSLLPPMCLNRYYLAEGVKLYNQETWRLVLGTTGRTSVALFIKEIVDFYVTQTESDNHAVREAACHCMAELSSKIEGEVVKPYVVRLLEALHFCFQDESWPVRDTACVACGNFILNFPEESKVKLGDFYPLFFANLHDPIPSVRQGAAVALTNVSKAYGEEALEVVFAQVAKDFDGIKDQKASSERYEGLDKGVATYGVIKQMRDNDLELHSNQQMYSCGSLAPKMGRKRGGGCMDHSFKRASEPWEAVDGCVYLISEMSHFPAALSRVEHFIPIMIKAAHHKHYTHYLHLLESINKVIPNMAKGLTKRVFKKYLEDLFEIIFESVSCESALTQSAAMDCLQFLNGFLGPSILRGRVEQYNPHYVSTLEKCFRTAGGPPDNMVY